MSSELCMIGSRLELFIDKYLIESTNGVECRMHTPQRMPMAASPVKGMNYMTVLKENDRFLMYYRAVKSDYTGELMDGHPGECTCLAESIDGIEWAFPKIGIHKINGSFENNAILADFGPFCHNFSPFIDSNPLCPDSERYKAVAGLSKKALQHVHQVFPEKNKYLKDGILFSGLWLFCSPDGIHWSFKSKNAIIDSEHTAFDSQNIMFWSEIEKQYVLYLRLWNSVHGKLRSIARMTSTDLVNWSSPVMTEPNLPEEHLYTSQIHPYFRAPHIYISLPTRYMKERSSSTDVLFMSSRAGSERFDRLFTEAFIRPGLDPERWENRSNYVALNVVQTSPYEMSIYHKSGHRYVLRLDGFISVNAGNTEGELLTKPLIFSGDRLVINYSTSAAGSLQIEIQDENGSPIQCFRMEDCSHIVGDEIERTVVWKDNPSLAALAGKSVRLRFVMKECDLYSFRFM